MKRICVYCGSSPGRRPEYVVAAKELGRILGFHEKPCGLLNVAGYYDGLFQFLEHAITEKFVQPLYRELLLLDDDPVRLLERYADYRAPKVRKWIGRDDT